LGASDGEVVVRWMELGSPSAATLARWWTVLDAAERARAGRFHFERDRVTYVAAHAMTRALLAGVGDLSAHEWRFVAGPQGKPEIDPALGTRLRFNMSHTSGLVAAAVCLDHDVGVDVEACDSSGAAMEVVDRCLAPSEVARLNEVPVAERLATFLRYWTLKEAYLKATGTGLDRPLDSFAFTLDPVRISFGPDVTDDGEQWQFHQHRPTSRHILAIALHRPTRQPATVIARAAAAEGHDGSPSLA